ncbi:GMC oxidoreductase [Pseudomonas kielensis]|uniref:GMC oxidoreductase n=1 Tax=Pseudomonas kielensis TaxID=2762577 RepID=UPI0038A5CC9A
MSSFNVDVVVVGSGAGGSTVAGRLGQAGKRVMVVEAGPVRFGTPGLHARNLDVSEAGMLEYAKVVMNEWVFPCSSSTPVEGLPGFLVSHGVGGSFSLWCSNAPSPDVSELPKWMDPAQWAQYFAEAARVMHVDPDIAKGGVRAERILAATRAAVTGLPAGREVQPMPIAARRVDGKLKYTSSDDLLAQATDGVLPQVLADHVVRQVLHVNGRASGVVAFPRQGGDPVVIHADTVVIASGTLAAAQLIHASGIDAGPALGRNLLDHPILSTRVVLRPEILEDVPAHDPIFSIWVPHSADHPWQTEVFRFPQTPAAGTRDEDGADITTFVAMDENPDNRISFDSETKDAFGLPQVRVHLQHSLADTQRISEALAEHYRVSAAVGDITRGANFMMYGVGGSAHLMGSCRMGPENDGTSVVDRYGQLWNMDNVFVAGNAVLGSSNSSNPTFTLVAAALRTADRILDLTQAL